MTTLHFLGPWDLHPDLAVVPDEPGEPVLLVESRAKGQALPWHRQKLALVLSAQRHFAQELREAGHHVLHIQAADYASGIRQALEETGADALLAHQQREWGLHRLLADTDWGVPCTLLPDGGEGGHFLLTRAEFAQWADGHSLRMDTFYRFMRKRTGWLMENGKPAGGKWSFDKENRKPAKGLSPPSIPSFTIDATTEALLEKLAGIDGLWGQTEGFSWPVTRSQALGELGDFIQRRLPHFGDYQDALLEGEDFLWHSRISAAMNLSLLHPREVCEAVLRADAPLNAIEGFVRQVLGWREFIRGVYWQRMPEMRQANALDAHRPLPRWYWEPETCELRCLSQAASTVERTGYGHHIQRLMVLGNFALLAGIEPIEVSHWFWAGFVDAQEWVQLPNVHGMALYADDGFTTKPYAASASYLHRMGDHCKECRFDHRKRTGEDACPFNSLFWHFMQRNAERLRHNGRMAQLLRTWDRWDEGQQQEIIDHAEAFLASMPPAEHGWTFADDGG